MIRLLGTVGGMLPVERYPRACMGGRRFASFVVVGLFACSALLHGVV